MNAKWKRNLGATALGLWMDLSIRTAAYCSTSGDGLPWEQSIETVANSVKGPVATSLAIIMFGACIWGVIRGAELSSWVAPTAITALAVATMGNADKILTLLGLSGAMIP